MNDFTDYLAVKGREYGKKFDSSELAEKFIPYYNSQKRIEVDFGYEVKRGRVALTTGWKPSFMLMLTTRSFGSCHLLSQNDTIIKEV